jgi:hypothetical protein
MKEKMEKVTNEKPGIPEDENKVNLEIVPFTNNIQQRNSPSLTVEYKN